MDNQAWRARSSHGRKPIFKTPDDLERACVEYLEWSKSTLLMAVELVKYQGETTHVEVQRMRAMSATGLCNFLDISHQTWASYRAKPDFLEVTERVGSIIYQQKFEVAAADMLNANIVSRELGLADKQKVNRHGGGLIISSPHMLKPSLPVTFITESPLSACPTTGVIAQSVVKQLDSRTLSNES